MDIWTMLSNYLLHKCQSTIHQHYAIHTISMLLIDRPWKLTRCWRRVEQSRKVIVKYKCACVVRIYLKFTKQMQHRVEFVMMRMRININNLQNATCTPVSLHLVDNYAHFKYTLPNNHF